MLTANSTWRAAAMTYCDDCGIRLQAGTCAQYCDECHDLHHCRCGWPVYYAGMCRQCYEAAREAHDAGREEGRHGGE